MTSIITALEYLKIFTPDILTVKSMKEGVDALAENEFEWSRLIDPNALKEHEVDDMKNTLKDLKRNCEGFHQYYYDTKAERREAKKTEDTIKVEMLKRKLRLIRQVQKAYVKLYISILNVRFLARMKFHTKRCLDKGYSKASIERMIDRETAKFNEKKKM